MSQGEKQKLEGDDAVQWRCVYVRRTAAASAFSVVACNPTRPAFLLSRPPHFAPKKRSMKVFSLAVVLAPPGQSSTVLSSASDLSTFSFYQRGSVGEFMSFFTRTISERTPQGQRQSVQENNYTAHVYNRGGAEQLAGTVSTCYILLRKVRSCSLLSTLVSSCDYCRSRISRSTCLLALD